MTDVFLFDLMLWIFNSKVDAECMSSDICIHRLHLSLFSVVGKHKINACVILSSVLNPCHSDHFSQMFHYLHLMRSLFTVFFFVCFFCFLLLTDFPSVTEIILPHVCDLSPPSVLRSSHVWNGCLTTTGSSLQRELSSAGAIKLYRVMWQSSICHVGSFAGEGPGSTILCSPEELACSTGHLHLCAPATRALQCQAEGFQYCCS